MKLFHLDQSAVAEEVSHGEIAIIPCDTIYGIVTSVFFPHSVERLYKIRSRDFQKPCIVLLAERGDIKEFISEETERVYAELFSMIWPGPVSIIVPVVEKKWNHLHRGKETLAFRVPDDENLRNFLKRSGPVIAPSANKEGENTARTIQEAFVTFGENVPFYVDGGLLSGKSSTLISLSSEGILVLREGVLAVEDIRRITKNIFPVSL
ncbi:MAG: threonylcarbamoyl-AMP synthase [Candidatus Moraniibacteriota bacterium]|nr:MAG: threonylcarbamoyl-AMP synthase [Candidatus Moranbacteria bacterium]